MLDALLRAAAYHEAGHAVAAAAMEYDVLGCSVDEHGVGSTCVCWPNEESTTIAGRRRLLTVSAAGDVAEMIGVGRIDDPAVRDVDAVTCAERMARLEASEQQREDGAWLEKRVHAEIAAARHAARKILETQWPDVEAIASSIGATGPNTGPSSDSASKVGG
jgi:predicted NAD/FAD-binding protein